MVRTCLIAGNCMVNSWGWFERNGTDTETDQERLTGSGRGMSFIQALLLGAGEGKASQSISENE